MAPVNRSSSLKLLLGTLAVAQEFTMASAEGMCRAFNNVGKKFDLIGLLAALGTASATKSLSYSALNDEQFFLTGHIGPGSLSVGAALFEATGFKLARLLSLAGAGDVYQIVQLDCPDGLRYIGLKSSTACPVSNTVGAAIVREHGSLWKQEPKKEPSDLLEQGKRRDEKAGEAKGRDAKRQVKVIVLEMAVPEEAEVRVQLKSGKGGALVLGWLPLVLTLGVVASACICKEWFVVGLTAWGMLAMMIGVIGLRMCLFKHSSPKVAKGAPEGDCVVVDEKDPDTLHLILSSKEQAVQAVLQRKLECQLSPGNYVLFLAACMFYVYTGACVLYLPNVSVGGQILYAIANLIGIVTDVVKASRNNRLGLARKAREQFHVELKRPLVFGNRTAAVSFVAKHAEHRSVLKANKLLPSDGPVWEKWWETLAKCEGRPEEDLEDVVAAAIEEVEEKHRDLLRILLLDMVTGLKI